MRWMKYACKFQPIADMLDFCFGFFQSSSPGWWLESVVTVVLLLSDMWGRTDHQDKTLQCSRASTGRQRLWGEWKGDSGLHCRAMSQWVFHSPLRLRVLYRCIPDKRPNIFTHHGCPRGNIPHVFWADLFSITQDPNKLSLFPFLALSSTFCKADDQIWTWNL